MHPQTVGIILLLGVFCGTCVCDEKFLLYDVSPNEGFNLRRDVYLRLAKFAKSVNYTLVLPPWGPLPHWKGRSRLAWKLFFDLESLNEYWRAIEFDDFRDRFVGDILIDNVYVLKHAPFTEFYEDKFYEVDCGRNVGYRRENGLFEGYFFDEENVKAKNVTCLEITGSGNVLSPLLRTDTIVMIDHAEVVLHEGFGDAEYWRVRKSMKFAAELRAEARQFIETHPKNEKYLGVHLRRSDFPIVRPNDVPSLRGAAEQVKKLLRDRKLTKVFLATDGDRKEVEEFLRLVPEAVVYHTQGVRFESSENLVENSSKDLCDHESMESGLSRHPPIIEQCSSNRGDLDKPCDGPSPARCEKIDQDAKTKALEMEEKRLPPGGDCVNEEQDRNVSQPGSDDLKPTCSQSGSSVDKPSMDGACETCKSQPEVGLKGIGVEERVLETSNEKCENPHQEKGVQSPQSVPLFEPTCTAGRSLDKPCSENTCTGVQTHQGEKQLAGKCNSKAMERGTTEKPQFCEPSDGKELGASCGDADLCEDGDHQDYIEGESYPRAESSLTEGQIAIVDQIICAHADVFVGSFESTFSFRIQEEREIAGKSPDTTFNRLCADGETDCEQPTRWTIVQ